MSTLGRATDSEPVPTRLTRADFRTWMLLVLALVPTVAVLFAAGWVWSTRGDEIAKFEAVMVRVDTTYELFAVSSKLERAEASLQAASLPAAPPEVIERAERDLAAAIISLSAASETLPPLVDQLDPERDALGDSEAFELIGNSVSLGSSILEQQVAGEPVNPQLTILVTFARESASGLVLPVLNGSDAETIYFYDAMSTTIEYYDQFDRDRAALITGLGNGVVPHADLTQSALRSSEWRDLIDSRTFNPDTAALSWFSTSQAPGAPLLLDSTEPLGVLLASIDSPPVPSQWGEVVMSVQGLDDALSADVELAYTQVESASDTHLATLLNDRRLTALAGLLVTMLGLGLAWLTVGEVRRRRSVEHAHDEAMTLLAEKADRDPTTGIWNRRRLEAQVPEMIGAANIQHEIVVLAYLDLDHFKAINDVWGHSTGDHVLRKVTDRLHGFVYEGTVFELCRFGGDEFVLYAQLPQRSLRWFEGLGQALIQAVDSEMEVNGRLHGVGASVGIASSNRDSTLDSLLLEADSSLILAKRERGVAVVYNRDRSRTGELVHALPAALAGGEIRAHIQPVVDAVDGSLRHVEALARWERGDNETVSPSVFVPLVEAYGLAEQLTTTMLGCVGKIIDSNETPESVRVWVNVSPRELDASNFASRFIEMLRTLKLAPRRIGVEITESAAVRDPERLAAELQRLRAIGIQVAIDDFGSGYSPLGYLRQLPVDVVKLDRSIISNIDADVANQHLVVGIVGLVHELGMVVVAEGVERAEEQAWLAKHGVTRVQGFLFAEPVSAESFDWGARTIEATPVVSSQQTPLAKRARIEQSPAEVR